MASADPVLRNLIVSGGVGHDFGASSSALADAIDAVGVTSTVVDEPHEALGRVVAGEAFDLVTVNALWWRMDDDRFADRRQAFAFELRDDEAGALSDFVTRGGSLLACHSAVICFDADPRWAELVGATWEWGRSSHPPRGEARIEVSPSGTQHPITASIAAFDTVDEVYGSLRQHVDIDPLCTSTHSGADHPVVWTRQVGRGRVVVDLLGHDAEAVANPSHRALLHGAARWLLPAGGAT